jgi:hypothetical protein
MVVESWGIDISVATRAINRTAISVKGCIQVTKGWFCQINDKKYQKLSNTYIHSGTIQAVTGTAT